jgi:hypothetical protein
MIEPLDCDEANVSPLHDARLATENLLAVGAQIAVSEGMIRTANRQEQPRKLLMPKRRVSAKGPRRRPNFRRLRGFPSPSPNQPVENASCKTAVLAASERRAAACRPRH